MFFNTMKNIENVVNLHEHKLKILEKSLYRFLKGACYINKVEWLHLQSERLELARSLINLLHNFH